MRNYENNITGCERIWTKADVLADLPSAVWAVATNTYTAELCRVDPKRKMSFNFPENTNHKIPKKWNFEEEAYLQVPAFHYCHSAPTHCPYHPGTMNYPGLSMSRWYWWGSDPGRRRMTHRGWGSCPPRAWRCLRAWVALRGRCARPQPRLSYLGPTILCSLLREW